MRACLRSIYFLLMINSAAVSAQEQSAVFQDDLLEHLVGQWSVTGIVHGEPSKQKLRAEWVINHQFLRVSESSVGNIGAENFPFEAVFYVGYDKTAKRYVVHLMTVWGADSDALGFGERMDNQLKITFSYAYGVITHRFIWRPDTKQWRILVQEGTAQPHVDLEATSARARPSN